MSSNSARFSKRSMATNSSPPRRAIMPSGPICWRIRWAIPTKASSPALCPWTSLISLKRFRSMTTSAIRPWSASAAASSRDSVCWNAARLGRPVSASFMAM